MNKQENRLTISVLTTLIAGIALIYTLIQYHDFLFAIVCISFLFLIAAFFFTQNLIAFSIMRNKSLNVHLKGYIDDISAQIEALGEVQSQIGKASYVYTKQAAQTLATLDNNYTESQNALFKNLASLSNIQNKAAKLNLKFDQDNTTKVIAAIKESRNQLNETMVNGFDQIQPSNTDVVTILNDIVNYLKTQTGGMNQGMELQLNNVAHELQNISNSIQRVQAPVQGSIAVAPFPMPESPISYPADAAVAPAETIRNNAEASSELTDQSIAESSALNTDDTFDTEIDNTVSPDDSTNTTAEDTETITDNTVDMTGITAAGTEEVTAATEVTVNTPEAAAAEVTTDITEAAATEVTMDMTEPTAAESGADMPEAVTTDNGNPDLTELLATADNEISPSEIGEISSLLEDINTLMTEDDANPIDTDTASGDVSVESEAFTPTFTVVGKESSAESKPAPDPADANKMLSPDEIAALFASTTAEATAPPEPAPVTPAPDPADANKMLSPDEIAALFASTAAETSAAPEPAPVTSAPDPADVNKMLSPDEIAALFASTATEATAPPEPEPTPAIPVPEPADANKMLSPDEIAALFASMG